MGGGYVSQQGAANLANYSYTGVDKSLIGEHLQAFTTIMQNDLVFDSFLSEIYSAPLLELFGGVDSSVGSVSTRFFHLVHMFHRPNLVRITLDLQFTSSCRLHLQVFCVFAQHSTSSFLFVTESPNVTFHLGICNSNYLNSTRSYQFAAAMIFTYQTMDNLDGKQARRTGSSSALGEVFDHGM